MTGPFNMRQHALPSLIIQSSTDKENGSGYVVSKSASSLICMIVYVLVWIGERAIVGMIQWLDEKMKD